MGYPGRRLEDKKLSTVGAWLMSFLGRTRILSGTGLEGICVNLAQFCPYTQNLGEVLFSLKVTD